MARKKQSEKNQGPATGDIDISKEIGVTQFRDEKTASVQNYLPTMIPQLDYILGGGLPFGRMVEQIGRPTSGKSTAAVHYTKIAQMMGVPVLWIDVENTTEVSRMNQLGVDLSYGIYKVQPNQKKDKSTGELISEPMTIERVAEKLEKLTTYYKSMGEPIVIIWDSVSQTNSARELERGVGDTMPGIQAKALTQFSKIVAPMINDSQTLFIAINQARDEMGSMFGGIDSSGGNAFKHWASLRLEVKKRGKIEEDVPDAFGGHSKEYVGHIMGVRTIKSKVSTPNRNADMYLMAESGLDIEENVYRAALAPNKQYSLISGGTWRKYTTLDGEEIKFNSNLKWVNYLKSEEGHATLVELFGRMMAISFPNGYAPFNSEQVDIRNIPLYNEIGEDYMNKFSPDSQKEPKEETQSKEDVDEMVDQV